MKNLFTLLMGLLLFYPAISQTMQTVVYTPSAATIANPERGFYKHTETYASDYEPLNQTSLTNYRVNNSYTLILRVFYLDNFVTSKISNSFLNSMKSDFMKIRAAGLKCVVRFAYSDDPSDAQRDATKSKILSHINQLKPILQANSDVIAVVQAGFIGAWGEWYYTDHFGMNPTANDYSNRKAVLESVLAAVPNRMVQVRTPKLKTMMYSTTSALSLTQAFGNSSTARIGQHNDCFLASSSDEGTYTSNIAAEYAYLEQETKYLPMGGESCAVNAPRSECQTALSELKKFHWSYMNLDYYPGVINGFKTGTCFDDIQNHLGYRFEMIDGTFANSATIGGTISVKFKVNNTGFASPFNQRKAYIILKNVATGAEYTLPMTSDPRFWAAQTITNISENLTLPASMTAGSYKLYLRLPDIDAVLAARPEYSIRMANDNMWNASNGTNDLQHIITVGSSGSRIAVSQPKRNIQLLLYPVPANNELVIETGDIKNIEVAIVNSLGQKIDTAINTIDINKLAVNTSGFANGIYFLSISDGQSSETKRFLINH
jgi:hypothetical protein